MALADWSSVQSGSEAVTPGQRACRCCPLSLFMVPVHSVISSLSKHAAARCPVVFPAQWGNHVNRKENSEQGPGLIGGRLYKQVCDLSVMVSAEERNKVR